MAPGGGAIIGAAPTPGGMPGGPSAPGGGAMPSGAAAGGGGLRDRERDGPLLLGEAARLTLLLSGASPIGEVSSFAR